METRTVETQTIETALYVETGRGDEYRTNCNIEPTAKSLKPIIVHTLELE